MSNNQQPADLEANGNANEMNQQQPPPVNPPNGNQQQANQQFNAGQQEQANNQQQAQNFANNQENNQQQNDQQQQQGQNSANNQQQQQQQIAPRADWEWTRKRIVATVGIVVGLIGFIVFMAGWIQSISKFDDEDCCANTCTSCNSYYYCGGTEYVFEDDGCCYGTDDKLTLELIFGLGAFACPVITFLLMEFGDKVCCQCCQKAQAIVLGILNSVGILFVVLVVVALNSTGDSELGCEDKSMYDIFGTKGAIMGGAVIMLFGDLAALILVFIECCCDGDSDEVNASP